MKQPQLQVVDSTLAQAKTTRLYSARGTFLWLGLFGIGKTDAAASVDSNSPDSRASRMRFSSCSSLSESMAIQLLRQDLAIECAVIFGVSFMESNNTEPTKTTQPRHHLASKFHIWR